MSTFTWVVSPSSLTEVKMYKKGVLKTLLKKTTGNQYTPQLIQRISEQRDLVQYDSYIHPGLVGMSLDAEEGFDSTESREKYIDHLISLVGEKKPITYIPSLDALESVQFKNFNWPTISLKKQADQLLADTKVDPLLTIGSEFAESGKVHFENSFGYLKTVWPEVYELTRGLISYVVWFTSPTYWSSTQGLSFGAIYVGPRANWNMLHYYETLLHEGGHLHLMIKEMYSPFVKNPLAKLKSPLRDDLRPVRGVFHACFVLSRMAEGMHRISTLDTPFKLDALSMAKLNTERLNRGLSSLNAVADYTPAGKELVDSINEVAEKLTKIYLA